MTKLQKIHDELDLLRVEIRKDNWDERLGQDHG